LKKSVQQKITKTRGDPQARFGEKRGEGRGQGQGIGGELGAKRRPSGSGVPWYG